VTLADLKEVRFPKHMSKPQLAEALKERYPAYKWDRVHLLKGRYAQQKRLERAVALLFPVNAVLVPRNYLNDVSVFIERRDEDQRKEGLYTSESRYRGFS